MAIKGTVGAVLASTGAANAAFVDQATTADGTRTRYTINDVNLRYWDHNQPVTVKVNGVVQASGFRLEHIGGAVVFDVARAPEDVVTVSGEAKAVAQVGGLANWSVDGGADTQDVTTFQSAGWKEFVSGLREWSGSAEGFWGSRAFFDALGQEVIVVLYVDFGQAKARFEGLAIVTGDGVETPVDGLVQESVDLQGTGPLYYREG